MHAGINHDVHDTPSGQRGHEEEKSRGWELGEAGIVVKRKPVKASKLVLRTDFLQGSSPDSDLQRANLGLNTCELRNLLAHIPNKRVPSRIKIPRLGLGADGETWRSRDCG